MPHRETGARKRPGAKGRADKHTGLAEPAAGDGALCSETQKQELGEELHRGRRRSSVIAGVVVGWGSDAASFLDVAEQNVVVRGRDGDGRVEG